MRLILLFLTAVTVTFDKVYVFLFVLEILVPLQWMPSQPRPLGWILILRTEKTTSSLNMQRCSSSPLPHFSNCARCFQVCLVIIGFNLDISVNYVFTK